MQLATRKDKFVRGQTKGNRKQRPRKAYSNEGNRSSDELGKYEIINSNCYLQTTVKRNYAE